MLKATLNSKHPFPLIMYEDKYQSMANKNVVKFVHENIGTQLQKQFIHHCDDSHFCWPHLQIKGHDAEINVFEFKSWSTMWHWPLKRWVPTQNRSCFSFSLWFKMLLRLVWKQYLGPLNNEMCGKFSDIALHNLTTLGTKFHVAI